MKNILLCLISISFLIADIHISGDARVRPRYDITENGDGSSTSDLYYMYRARLNMKADIGDGWFFNTSKNFGLYTSNPSTPSPLLDFKYLLSLCNANSI